MKTAYRLARIPETETDSGKCQDIEKEIVDWAGIISEMATQKIGRRERQFHSAGLLFQSGGGIHVSVLGDLITTVCISCTAHLWGRSFFPELRRRKKSNPRQRGRVSPNRAGTSIASHDLRLEDYFDHKLEIRNGYNPAAAIWPAAHRSGEFTH